MRAANHERPTPSVWQATASLPTFAPLAGDQRADVCVVGAGIAGLTTAYMLARERKSVIVLEADAVGSGETGRSTAHFFPPDEHYVDIERGFGSDTAALVADTFRKAADCVEAIVRTERIDCDFERLDGYLFNPGGQWSELLEREYATTTRLGLHVRRLERVPGLHFDTGPCLRFAHQAQFHPLRYLDGLARAIVRLGGRIHEGSRVLDVEDAGARQHVRTATGRIDAGAVVMATNLPFGPAAPVSARQATYRSYVIALRVPRDALPRLLLWDTGAPYHYVRLASGGASGELLIVGGQDHPLAEHCDPEQRYAALEAWARQRFPIAGALERRWYGDVHEPADGLALLGRCSPGTDNVYLISGDSGNGMTYSTAGAILVTDLIVGRKNAWSALYAPTRKAFHGAGSFITEDASSAAQYRDWLRGGDVDTVDQIAAGQGALVKDDGRLLAVYRSADGGLQAVSAACTHLGCAVHWNGPDQSWDCPCHGSRFAADGAVLHGPARRPLVAASLAGGGPPRGERGDAAGERGADVEHAQWLDLPAPGSSQ